MSFQIRSGQSERFRIGKFSFRGRRRRFILLLFILVHYTLFHCIVIGMCNSDMYYMNGFVNRFINCIFDYYILSFRCEILCCFISFIFLPFLFLITPITICPFNGLESTWVFDRRFKLSKKAGRYSWYQSFGLAINLGSSGE